MSDLETYKAYVSDAAINTLYTNPYRGYKMAFDEFVNKIDSQNMSDIDNNETISEITRKLSSLQNTENALSTIMSSQNVIISSQQFKISELEHTCNINTKKINDQDALITKLSTNHDNDRIKLYEHDEQITILRKDISDLRAENTDLRTSIDDLRAENAELRAENTKLNTKVDKLTSIIEKHFPGSTI